MVQRDAPSYKYLTVAGTKLFNATLQRYTVGEGMKTLEDMFLHTKPARILVGLNRGDDAKYASVLSKEADCTYSHTVKILDQFKEHGLIEFSKEGRKKLIHLTESGDRLAQRMEELMAEIDGDR